MHHLIAADIYIASPPAPSLGPLLHFVVALLLLFVATRVAQAKVIIIGALYIRNK
jgi:hypothetical protein